MSCKDGWTPDEIDSLINLVRPFTDIYDQSKSGHSNINNIDSLWIKISQNLATKTPQQCKKKWQILRSGYRQRRHHDAPSGSGAVKTVKWAYFETLTFLEPYLAERKTSSNIGPIAKTPVSNETVEFDENVEQSCTFDEATQNEDTSCTTNEEQGRDDEISLDMRTDINPRRRKRNKRESVDVVFMQYLQKKNAEGTNPAPTSTSANAMFLLSLEEDMNKLDDNGVREFKLEVLSYLYNKLKDK